MMMMMMMMMMICIFINCLTLTDRVTLS